MRTLLLVTAFLLPALAWAQQKDCQETPADLASKSAIQIDTIVTMDPETRDRNAKVYHIYHMDELPIVERKKENGRTYFYVEKNDCLVIRHVEEIIK